MFRSSCIGNGDVKCDAILSRSVDYVKMANFAKLQMLKYGWTEGKGLGKSENGITEALKPIVKLDNAGIGYQKNEYNWLSSLLSTKHSVDLTHKSDKIPTSDNDQQKVHVNKYKTTHQEAYEKFENTSTLQDGNLIQNSSAKSDEEESTKSVNLLPTIDDKLFKACGSRTTHKTARHGHTLSGKLERLALQDKMFSNVNASGLSLSQSNTNSVVTDTKMIHRKMKAESDTEETEEHDGNTSQSETERFVSNKFKTTRKKHRRKINHLLQQLSTCNIEENDTSACNSAQRNDKKIHRRRKNKERKKSKEHSSLKNNLEDEANDKLHEASFSLNKSTEYTNIQKQVTGLVKSYETEMDKLPQNKSKHYNKKKRARSQERDSMLTIDELEDICSRKSKLAKKLCKKNIPDWYSLMLDDETSKAQNKQEIDSYEKEALLQNDGQDMISYTHFTNEKIKCKKVPQMPNECKTQLNAPSENYEKKKKNKITHKLMFNNVPIDQSFKVKKSKKYMSKKIMEETARLNFRIQKKKKRRYIVKQKKKVENVINKLKEKVFSHDINALIKDLTTINITEQESIMKKKLTQTQLTSV